MTVFTPFDFVFNGFNFSRYMYVENIRRSFLPSIENTLTRVGNHGLKHRKLRTGPRRIEVDVRMIHTTRWNVGELRSFVAGKMLTTEPKMLKLRDTDMFDIAILDGEIDFERWLYTGFATLTFLNPSGLTYRKYNIIETNDLVFNSGSHSIQPIIKISPTTQTNKIIIRNLTTKQYLELNRNMEANSLIQFGELNEQLEYREIVKYNDLNAMKSLAVDSDFFYLEPDMNEIEIVGADKATFEFWECYV
ncbi:distal tail protein Dit [Microaceticoccus formicicus]|uniref:distal tail protein Dit n=1 Tax=Microaceticoccus formicicus TaxID=3118105 RepID=UPI003CD00175|nr:distal tail protein Dit [Peptoniphilaceae bacterium AMB_02]